MMDVCFQKAEDRRKSAYRPIACGIGVNVVFICTTRCLSTPSQLPSQLSYSDMPLFRSTTPNQKQTVPDDAVFRSLI